MADENKMALAKIVYADLCTALDHRNWNYTKHEDDLVVTFAVSGEDIPMEFVLIVDAERQLLRVLSKLPFVVPEDKRMDLALATCYATNRFVDGSFDYDITTGTIFFRMTASFRESRIGEGLFAYLIDCSCYTIDKYNDKFLAISKGVLSIDDFLTQQQQ